MKKNIIILILTFALILGLASNTFGLMSSNTIGELLGNVLSTDIVTYINDKIVPSFNFDGRTAIYATDLREAGFTVTWNNDTRSVSIVSEDGNTQSSVTSVPTIDKGMITYSDAIEIPIANSSNYSYSLVDSNHNSIVGIRVDNTDSGAKILNTYYLQLGTSYHLLVINKSTLKLTEINFTVSPNISKESFTDTYALYDANSVVVPANDAKGFSFPYRLMYSTESNFFHTKTPFDSIKPELMVETANHGVDNSFENMMSKTLGFNPWALEIAKETQLNGFIMYAILPRIAEGEQVYTHALDRQTLFGSEELLNDLGRGNIYRLDNQVVAMQEDAKQQLANLGVAIDKPILVGFSSASDFASRLNMVHPDLAKAVIINDAPTMPFTEYNGVTLNYPLGMADIQDVTGEPFDKEKFIDTPQFWTTGTHDENDGTYFQDGWGSYTFEDRYDDAHYNLEGKDYRKAFGNDIIARKELIRKLLVENGFNNIEFHTYDVGHGVTPETFIDISTFLEKIM